MQTTFKKTLTFKEIIEYTGLSRKVIQSFVDNGSLKFINTNMSGNTNLRYAFMTSEVDKFLERIQQTMTEGKK
ncbi:MAG TPA: hypothetical protein DCP51_00355 [Clostridiales bacterium]|nr:MAG: hypothetical protein A2X42_04070 [Candidatus Margulisbacteria bacterium GWF2_38_17]OGI07161.1 MAG: hypothetical protein A2X41_06140 [Candidatus Margulisbacteria bacterium GWE2_39_32]HAN20125.1 hypothetical protein [Clostridiales bacterium]HCT84724.1 hypothetical protein [Candidatus Margulisiibacteriota bacterium]